MKDYPCPGGGCRLTDPQFAKRLKEALDHEEDTIRDIQLLKYGRHVRLPSGAKVIVGRNEEENKMLLQCMNPEDIALEVIGTGSPITLIKKHKGEGDLRQATKLCIRYSDAKEKEKVSLKIKHVNGREILSQNNSERGGNLL